MSLFAFLLTQSLNAFSQAALLFFLGVGLTLIFGIMRIINFAHGAIYMFGAYVGYSLVQMTGSFWVAMVLAPVVVAALGSVFELVVLKRLYRRDGSAFLMVTFGLALCLGEVVRLGWGSEALLVQVPELFDGVAFILDEPFPLYRMFLIGAGGAMAICIWQVL